MSNQAKSPVKLNKKHGGKEFYSKIVMVGKVKKSQRYNKDLGKFEEVDYLTVGETKNGKTKQTLMFDLQTAEHNTLSFELTGFKNENIVAFAEDGGRVNIPWDERLDESKVPSGFRTMPTDWDRAEKFANEIKQMLADNDGDVWLVVRGKHTFSSNEGEKGTYYNRRRVPIDIKQIKNSETVQIGRGTEKITYITDFKDENFVEVNYFETQIGIRSTYQDPTTRDTKVNAVFLSNGTDRSVPNDCEFVVPYKEPSEGKKANADIFATFNRLDFLKVYGIDHNRQEKIMVEVETVSDDPFADADNAKAEMEQANGGSIKHLEILGGIKGTYVANFLTEDEIKKLGLVGSTNNTGNNAYDPFADDGNPLDISDDDLPF